MNESEQQENTRGPEVTFYFEPQKSTEESSELLKRHIIFDSILIKPNSGEDRLVSLGSSMKSINKSAGGEGIVFVDNDMNRLNIGVGMGGDDIRGEQLESRSDESIASRKSGKTPPTPKSLTELASYGKSGLRDVSGRSSSEFVSTKLVEVVTQLPPAVQQNLLGLLTVMANEMKSSNEDPSPSEQTNPK